MPMSLYRMIFRNQLRRIQDDGPVIVDDLRSRD